MALTILCSPHHCKLSSYRYDRTGTAWQLFLRQSYPFIKLGKLVIVEHLIGVGDVGSHGVGLLQRGVAGHVVHPVHFVQGLTELLSEDKFTS